MSDKRRILFVCLHGAAKSVLAAIDCERLAAARGLEVTADFAGTEPDAGIAPARGAARRRARGAPPAFAPRGPDANTPPAVAAALRAEGLDLRDKKPRLVTRGD